MSPLRVRLPDPAIPQRELRQTARRGYGPSLTRPPDTLTRAVEQAGGQVVHLWHVSDRQYVTKSLEITGANFSRALLRLPPARRVSSLILWLACQLGFGEAIRVMIRAAKS